jgi:WD40 repeat protein
VEDSLTIIQDTKRLILAFGGLLSSNALQVYDCLTFVPHGTALYKHYAAEKPPMCMILNARVGWTPLLSTLEGHANSVGSVVFSLDGSRLASCSHDKTVRLWDAHTGAAIGHPMDGHTNWV